MSAGFDHDRFFVRQRFAPVVNRYEISTLAEDGRSAGEPVAFFEQRRFKLKEELTAWADDTKSQALVRIKARQAFDPSAEYEVFQIDGNLRIGTFRKRFGRSLLRSTWDISSASTGAQHWAQERSLPIAIFRRIAGFLPYVGNFADWLPIPYHFDFYEGEERIGTYTRILGIADRYVLDLSADAERRLDRRVAVALAVCLDALQAR
jgi:hypothetical protein